jgi:hypothetical protein
VPVSHATHQPLCCGGWSEFQELTLLFQESRHIKTEKRLDKVLVE